MRTLLMNLAPLVAIAGLLAVGSVGTAQTVWFSDDYETDTVGTDPAIQLGDVGNGYTIVESLGAPADYVQVWNDAAVGLGFDSGNDGQYTSVNRRKIDPDDDWSRFHALMTDTVDVTEGVMLTAEFDAYLPVGRNLAVIGGDGDPWNTHEGRLFYATFYANDTRPGQAIKVFEAPSGTYLPNSNHTREIWQHITFKANGTTKKWSLTVGDDVASGDLDFYSGGTTKMSEFAIGCTWRDSGEHIYIDNVTVTEDVVVQIPGDTDGDGDVDADDAAKLAENWGTATINGASDGDFNADGKVDAADASILAAQWTGPSEANGVPEPSVLALLLGLPLVLLFRRRR